MMLAFLLLLTAASLPAGPQDETFVSGRCEYPAEIGKPGPGEHRSACQSVIISPGSGPNGVLVQFAGGTRGEPIGFAGDVVDDTMSVRRIYIRPGAKVEATSGHCRIFFTGKKISGVSCVGRSGSETYVANFVAR